MAVRVRRDIWSLESEQTWHPITRAYALGIQAMQARDASDVTSWAYQAQIHGMPDGGQPDDFRGQCQHQSWFFLPWHRLYLHWFEQIVLAAVQAHPDIDADVKDAWALPYWNYTPGGDRATLPPAYREPELPDAPGTPNPLFNASRNGFVNDGDPIDPLAIDPSAALAEPVFSVPRPSGGFGGAETGFNHLADDPRRFPGALEQTPHNDVHMEVGGDMAGFDTAGLDPVFWLHHANIDRLWSVWIAAPDAHHDDPDPTGPWGTTVAHFHGPDGAAVSGSASGVLDTAADLGYEYEDIGLPALELAPARRQLVPSQPPPDTPAELVGATEQPLELHGAATSVALAVGAPEGPAARTLETAPAAGRVYLTVEGIVGDGPHPVTYAVYVNLPDGADPDDEPDVHYAGNLSLFGLEQSRNVDADPGGHALARSYDITTLVAGLREAGEWDPSSVSVSFVPLRRGRDARRGVTPEATGPPARIGRVGVYVQ